eukprot:TRINITY_DN12571_c0_g1_i1.p1 TRINITY_DN12571_c0_g1~~TRINITY_DN12571_c0_g1_i1.p1  ORF type:complete len:965 (-),score=254.82 TRINITY_DN12571_c0_g1_i1:111-2666(-)
MNQQRSRRYLATQSENKKKANGTVTNEPEVPQFDENGMDWKNPDSNQITPGTPFMAAISRKLEEYLSSRIQSNTAWQQIEVLYSSHLVVGEGEHKIVDFIRKSKASCLDQRHVLYGGDADLIMLSLALHIPRIYILRENQSQVQCYRCSQYGHLSYECTVKKEGEDNNESSVNTTLHIGNLAMEATEKDLHDHFAGYGPIKEIRIALDKETFQPRGFAFVEFMEHAAAKAASKITSKKLYKKKITVGFAKTKMAANPEPSDDKIVQFQAVTGLSFEECIAFLTEAEWNVEFAVARFFDPSTSLDDFALQRQLMTINNLETGTVTSDTSFKRRLPMFQMLQIDILRQYLSHQIDFGRDPSQEIDHERYYDDYVASIIFGGNDFLPSLQGIDIDEEGVDLLMTLYKDQHVASSQYLLTPDKHLNAPFLANYLKMIATVEQEVIFLRARRDHRRKLSRFPKRKDRRNRSNSWKQDDKDKTEPGKQEVEDEDKSEEDKSEEDKEEVKEVEDGKEEVKEVEATKSEKRRRRDPRPKIQRKTAQEWNDWKKDYYRTHFGSDDASVITDACHQYVKGMTWVLYYYYQGCVSWKYYYRHHWPPLACDLAVYVEEHPSLLFEYEKGSAFLPFQQLMAVLPPKSGQVALPAPYASLMEDPDSPIVNYYRTDFGSESYKGVACPLLPFIDEDLLLALLDSRSPFLTQEEQSRNIHRQVVLRVHVKHPLSRMFPLPHRVCIDPHLSLGLDGWLDPMQDAEESLCKAEYIYPETPVMFGPHPDAHFEKGGLSASDLEHTHFVGKRMQSLQCFQCGKIGHFAEDCESSDRAQSLCFHCGQVGHFVKECPVRLSKEETPVDKKPQT